MEIDIAVDENLSYTSENNEEGQLETQHASETHPPPIVAEYSHDELEDMVNLIKKMTVLYMFDPSHWNDESIAVIQSWLISPTHVLLTIFYYGERLIASLEIPDVPVYDFMYLLKEPNAKFTVDNFHDDVIFGKICEDVDGTLLMLMERVYVPLILNLETGTSNTKKHLAEGIQNFLVNLTRLHYMMAGIAVFFVPQHVLIMGEMSVTEKVDAIRQIETIADHWISILRTCLCDKHKISPYNSTNLCEEYTFWTYRYEVLYSIKQQVAQKDFLYIISIIQQAQSTFAKEIENLIEQISSEIKIANSNIYYLKLLINVWDDLNAIEAIIDAFLIIPKFIQTIVYIRLYSDYYNTNEIGSELFAKLTNQIILYCQKRIDVIDAFNSKPHIGIKCANEAIDFCLYYQVIFRRIMGNRNDNFVVNESVIFNYLDIFVERLYNFIEINQGIMVFECKNEIQTFPNLFFGGIREVLFKQCCANIHVIFTKEMDRIRHVETNFLDVHNYENGWPEQIKCYHIMIENLEETIENLIKIVFADVATVEEGIHALAGLFYYSLRRKIRRPYVKHTIMIWQALEREIKNTNNLLLNQLKTRNSQVPRFAGRVSDLVTNNSRITSLKQLFESAEWLPEYAYADKICQIYSKMESNMVKMVKNLFEKWLNSHCTEPILNLNSTIMARSVTHPGLLRCNLSNDIFSISQEINYDAVVRLLIEYNRILITLSEKERLLFRCSIQVCDSAFMPAVYKFTWNSEGLDTVIGECIRQVDEFKTQIQIYRKVNMKIAIVCEEICEMNLVHLEPNENGHIMFNEVVSKFVIYSQKSILELQRKQNHICELLFLVLNGFEPHIKNMACFWNDYILKFDYLLLEAIKNGSRNSLAKIHALLYCNGTIKQSFLLHVDVHLNARKLILRPTQYEIFDFLGNIYCHQQNFLSHISNLCDKIGVKRPVDLADYKHYIEMDDACGSCQQMILTELKYTREQTYKYMKQWEPFAVIWELDKDLFMHRYREIDPNATPAEFLVYIKRYVDVLNQIFFREIESPIQFLVIDCSNFKQTLYDEIQIWCSILRNAAVGYDSMI